MRQRRWPQANPRRRGRLQGATADAAPSFAPRPLWETHTVARAGETALSPERFPTRYSAREEGGGSWGNQGFPHAEGSPTLHGVASGPPTQRSVTAKGSVTFCVRSNQRR